MKKSLLVVCCLLVAIGILTPIAHASQVDAEMHSAVEAWMDSYTVDTDGDLARVLLEAQTQLEATNAFDAETETDADAEGEVEGEMDVDSENKFQSLVSAARRRRRAPPPPPAARQPAPQPPRGLINKLKANTLNLGNKAIAGLKMTGQKAILGAKSIGRNAVNRLQSVLSKSPKLAALGNKIGNKLKSVSSSIKAKLRESLAKAKTPAQMQKAILEAKKAAKQAKRAAVKVANKAVQKANKGKKGKKVNKSKADKKNKKKLTGAQKLKAKSAKKAGKGSKSGSASSKEPRDAEGRFLNRYKIPVHTSGIAKGQQKTRPQLNKSESKAYKVHETRSKVAYKTLKSAQAKAKTVLADAKFAKSKVRPLRRAAQKAARAAAKAVKDVHAKRKAAVMGGPKAQAELAQAQVNAANLQKAAIAAQKAFRSQRGKSESLKVALKAQRKVVKNAKASIHENGFDLLLSKVSSDLKKLDKSLFGKKVKKSKKSSKKSKKSKKSSKSEWRTVRRSVDIPDSKHPGGFVKKDMDIVERIRTSKVPIMAEREIDDPKRPGFKTRKFIKTVRKVKPAPKATQAVTILTKKEQRPYKMPNGSFIPVEVTYQVATQTVRAKSNGGTPAGFTDQEVEPPPESGLVYEEKTKEFPVLIGDSVRNLPFKVATWSKSYILLKEVNGRRVGELKTKEVEDGASPIPITQLQSSPRQLDGKLQVSILKQVPVKTTRGFELKGRLIDVPVTSASKPVKVKSRRRSTKPKKLPKQKLKVVLEGVDNSLAQQQARQVALKAVEEDIEDLGSNGSISERHLKAGKEAHEIVDRVRENFFDHQEQLVYKQLIRPEHRFID